MKVLLGQNVNCKKLITQQDKKQVQAIDTIMALIEILREIDDIDTLGNGISMKAKILVKIDELIDTL